MLIHYLYTILLRKLRFIPSKIGPGYKVYWRELVQTCYDLCNLWPIARRTYTKPISGEIVSAVEESIHHAREELREWRGVSEDGITDILVVMEHGKREAFLPPLVIAYVTGKVIDYQIMSKHCAECQHWESWDKTSAKYRAWKEKHACNIKISLEVIQWWSHLEHWLCSIAGD